MPELAKNPAAASSAIVVGVFSHVPIKVLRLIPLHHLATYAPWHSGTVLASRARLFVSVGDERDFEVLLGIGATA